MPGKVKVKVVAGKNLPVMDRSNDTTDAYVEVKLGNVTFKTDVCRKSLNPQWNSEWFRFEMDDLELQDEPLQIRLMDHDTYSANDSIGKVYIDLNPLLTNPSKTKEPSGRSMSGWIPVYDTMHGIRGEVNLLVKVELFSDLNKFRQSSCGVKFFFSSRIPEGHQAIQLHGFVEELVVNDDPEYQWIDKIRTPRASNEARQTLFSKLSGEVQRRVGLKALELGGNAVIGYRQCFDLEGESGIVVRGIGTAATLTKSYDNQLSPIPDKEYLLDDELSPLLPQPSPSSVTRRPFYSKSTSLVSTAEPLYTSSRLTTSSMSDSILRRLHTNPPLQDFRHKSLAEVILSLSSPTRPCVPIREQSESSPLPFQTLCPSHRHLTPQTSCDSSIITFRRGSMLESDDDRNTDVEGGKSFSAHLPNWAATEIHKYKPHRVSKKKDKYSTTGLLKRANVTVTSLPGSALSSALSSTDRIKDEFMKFFKREKSFQSPEIKCKSGSGVYRKPRIRRDIFSLGGRIRRLGRKRQRRPTELRRSTSDSFSVGRQSLESLPSIRSEEMRFDHEWSGTMNYPCLPSTTANSRVFDLETLIPPNPPETRVDTSALVEQTSSIMEAFRGLRYEHATHEPLRLYISSIDALLVCNPSQSGSSGASSRLPSSPCLAADGSQVPCVECMAGGSALAETNKDPPSFSLSANNELTFGNVLDVFCPPPDAERSGSSAVGGGSTGEIQMHEESTTSYIASFPPSNNATPHSVISVSEPIPEEQSNSSNENSLVESKTKVPMLNSTFTHSNPTHLIHEIKSTVNGRSKGSSSALSEQAHSGSVNNMNMQTQARGPPSASPVKVFSPNTNSGLGTNGRRSSESDLSTPPKGILNSSIQAILSGAHGKGANFSRRPAASSDHFDMLEYPFITIYDLPPKFIQRIGGSVSARSVKLLERISNLDEPESRDSWWTEIRMEIRSHARSICCNVILGYEEHTTICDDVCILSATGTAAIVNSAVIGDTSEASSKFNLAPPDVKAEKERVPSFRSADVHAQNSVNRTLSFSGASGGARHGSGDEPNCAVCHIPYNEAGVPFTVKMARCGICKKARVPDLVLATINIPTGVPLTGKSCLIQAQVFRPKKDCKGESSAKEVSDSLPFLEYELHRRLINKLKVKGMNAIFCLSVQICLGENLIMAIATGTAVCLTGLPTPELPKITAGNLKTDTQKVCQFQKVVQDAFDRNREFYKVGSMPSAQGNTDSNSSEDDSEDDSPIINLATGNKDTYVLEVDDSEDIEIISELIDTSPPVGFEMSNLEHVLGYDDFTINKQQMFIHIWRCRIPALTLRQLAMHFDRILRSISFKLRSMRPCILNKIRLRLELPEADEMQVCVTGTALGLKEKVKILENESCNGSGTILPSSNSHSPMLTNKGSELEDTEMMFNLECDGNNMNCGESSGSGGSNQESVAKMSGALKTTHPVALITVSSPSSPSPTPSRAGAEVHEPIGTPAAPTIITRGSLHKLITGNITIPNIIPLGFTATRLSASPLSGKFLVSPYLGAGVLPSVLPPFPVCSIPPLSRSRTSVGTGVKKARGIIEITTLSHIPGQRIEKYLGNLNFFFIRETTSIKEMGGPTGFVHSFVMEVTAILRGHVSALGGNALVSYFMTELSLLYNPHKNQGQCLISVGGDAVLSLPPNPLSVIQDE